MNKTVAVDFDGCIAEYVPGQATSGAFGCPVAGAREALVRLRGGGWTVVVFTARDDVTAIWSWLKDHDIPFDRVTHEKPAAHVYVDDRALRFDGDWPSTLEAVQGFEPYYYREVGNERDER